MITSIINNDVFLTIVLFINIVAMYRYFRDNNPIKAPTAIWATVVIRGLCTYLTPTPIFAMQCIVITIMSVTILFKAILLFVAAIEWFQVHNIEHKGVVFIMMSLLLLAVLLEAFKYQSFLNIFRTYYEGG